MRFSLSLITHIDSSLRSGYELLFLVNLLLNPPPLSSFPKLWYSLSSTSLLIGVLAGVESSSLFPRNPQTIAKRTSTMLSEFQLLLTALGLKTWRARDRTEGITITRKTMAAASKNTTRTPVLRRKEDAWWRLRRRWRWASWRAVVLCSQNGGGSSSLSSIFFIKIK